MEFFQLTHNKDEHEGWLLHLWQIESHQMNQAMSLPGHLLRWSLQVDVVSSGHALESTLEKKKKANKTQSTLHTPSSACIFSLLFSIYFLRCWQGEFVQQSTTALVGDHILYSCCPYVWFRGDTWGEIKC